MVSIKWFYRGCELPENVYQLLAQDRTSEHEQSAVHRPAVRRRELFISDVTDTFPVSVLRGHCRVLHYSDVLAVRDFVPTADTFFYVLTYNPETRRLASTQGEIRVGPSHQARLPEYRGLPHAGIPPRPTGATEQQLWLPGRAADTDLLMFLRAARSMAAFAGMCDGGSTDEGCAAASRDDTTQNALNVLHRSAYDQGVALQALVKSPVPVGVQQRWSEEETKKFVKGLRQHGKNFFRIRKELLPHKDTSELVEFYYMWKKTPGAQGTRPRNIARHKRSNGGRRIKSRKGAPKQHKDDQAVAGCDVSSASEAENDESDDSDSTLREISAYHCRHCFTTSSKDWHHAGKEQALLCTGCRMHFKKYGELPELKAARQPPFPLERPGATETAEHEGRMRTRTRAKQTSRGHRGKRLPSSRAATPSDAGRQSPGSSCSAESSSGKSRSSTSQPQRRASPQAVKRSGSPSPSADDTAGKKKRSNSTSAEDSLSDSVSEAEAGTDAPDLPSSQASSPSLNDQPTEPEDPPQIKSEPPWPPTNLTKPEPVKPEPAKLEPPEPEPAVVPAETAAAADQEEAMPPTEPHIPAAGGAAAAFTESSSEEDVKPNLPRLEAALSYPDATSGSPVSPSPAPTPVEETPPLVNHHQQQEPTLLSTMEAQRVKLEPCSDSDEMSSTRQVVPSVPPPLPLVVKQEPRSNTEEDAMAGTAVLTTHTLTTSASIERTSAAASTMSVVHPSIPPLPPHPPMPSHPAQPLYPQGYPYGYPYQQYGYPYPGYPVRPPPPQGVAAVDMLDLRKSEVSPKDTPSARNAVSVVTRTTSSHTSSAPERASPSVPAGEASVQTTVAVGGARRPYPYGGYPPSLAVPSASVHISQSRSVSATGPLQLTGNVSVASQAAHIGAPIASLSASSSVHLTTSPRLGSVSSSTSSSSTQHTVSVHFESSQSSSHYSVGSSSSIHVSSAPSHVRPPSVPLTAGSVIAQAPPVGGPPPLISRLPTPPPPAPPPSQSERHATTSPPPHLRLMSPSEATGPPSTQALPPTIVPTVAGYHDGKPVIEQVNIEDDDDVTPSPPVVRPPSPEPKVEDSECHRSQSAIFLRHLNRGENSSCARTDMTFKPVPESKLARMREERQRRLGEKQEKERAEKERQQQQQARKEAADRREKESPRTPVGDHADRYPVRPSESGLPRLSDYGRPLSVISPGTAAPPFSSCGFHLPPHVDPMYAMASGLPPGMYPRDRMELEMLERRERELRERDLNERLKEEMLKSRPLDPHWLEMQRRQMIPGMLLPPGAMYPPPPSPAMLSALERERMGGGGTSVPLPPSDSAAAAAAAADRIGLNMADPMVRLQMAGMGVPVPPEYHSHAHAHTHSHSHAHTHLHLHPGDAAAAAAAAAAAGLGLPGLPAGLPSGYGPPRPGLLPPRPGEPLFAAGYPPHLPRPYEDQLAQLSAHAAAQEHLQRQMLERERLGLSLPSHHMPPTSLHSSLLAHQAQQEEYIRIQREREKRALEEASRLPPKP